MAIQATNNLEYNYGSYSQPYFRVTIHYPVGGTQVPVDCFMYPSKNQYSNGVSSIACFPFYINIIDIPETGLGYTILDKYLYFITQKVVEQLQNIYPNTTFEITGIPIDAPTVEGNEVVDPTGNRSF